MAARPSRECLVTMGGARSEVNMMPAWTINTVAKVSQLDPVPHTGWLYWMTIRRSRLR